ncbi:unnamed protein product [Umbelopsis sp. WA50703]
MKFTLFHAASLILAITSVSALPRPRTNANPDVSNQASAVEVQKSKSAPAFIRDTADNLDGNIVNVLNRDDRLQDVTITATYFTNNIANLADDILGAEVASRVAVDGKSMNDRFALLNLLNIIKSLSSQITAVTQNIHRLDSQSVFNKLIKSIDHAQILVTKFESGLEELNHPDLKRYTDRFVQLSKKFKQNLQNLEKERPSKTDKLVLDEFDDIVFASSTPAAVVKRKEAKLVSHYPEHKSSASAVEVHKISTTRSVLPQEVIDAFAEFDDGRSDISEIAESAEIAEIAEVAAKTTTSTAVLL